MIVHLVTDRRRLCGGAGWTDCRACLVRQVAFAVAAGIDAVQVREPDLPAVLLFELVCDLVRLTRGHRTRILVNDRVDVALAAGADGVHLPARSLSPSVVRRHVPPHFLIGRSVHAVADLARAHGADYLIAGTVWSSASKAAGHATLDVEGLAAIANAASCPVLAIGGVTVERAATLHGTATAGAAAIGLFMDDRAAGCAAVPVADVVAALRRSFDTSGSGS
jgi:thiamine-phosphate pyrophosphorylase